MVGVLADAGAAAGLGHVARSTALAVALAARGRQVECRTWGDDAVRRVDGVEWRPLAGLPSAAEVARYDALVVDTYTIASETLAVWARHVPLTLFSDGRALPAGTRLAIGVGGLSAPPGTTVLSGPRHACVREPFWDVPPRRVRPEVARVLLSVGGGSHPRATRQAVAAARAAVPGRELTLVLGPYADAPEDAQIALLRAPADLRGALLSADLVLCAAGQTVLEATACGTPCLAFAMADNQSGQLRALDEAGAVAALSPDPDAWPEAIAALAADAGRRQELAVSAQRAVDGRGAERVAAALDL